MTADGLGDSLEPRRVLLAGETMLLLYGEVGRRLELADTFRASTAGAETNVAIGLARLGHRARLVGRLGADLAGESVLRRLRAEGLELEFVVRDPDAPTGLLIRDVHAARETHVGYYRAGSAASRWSEDDVSDALLGGVDLVHLTGITPMLSAANARATRRLLDRADAAGIAVSFDPNVRLRLGDLDAWRTVVAPLLSRVSIVLAGDDELAQLGVEVDDLLAAGVGSVVVKNADKSATAHLPGEHHHQPGFSVPAVDAVGAGDAFAAGYLSGLLEDRSVPQCLTRAALVAALAVQTVGDNDGLPDRRELRSALAAGGATGVVHR